LSRFARGDPRTLPAEQARAAVREAVSGLADEARARLAEIRGLARAAPRQAALAAFLPLALIEPYLRALESPRHDPLAAHTDISPLVRVARLWLAKWRGRV
jgi:phytoene synthase